MPSFLITGASKGLGYEFVRQLSSFPTNVVIGLVRNKDATEAALAKDNIKNVTIIQGDITDLASLKAAAEKTKQVTGGSLDVLINNAAYVSMMSSFKTLGDFDAEVLEQDLVKSFDINVVGVVKTINVFMPLIQKGDVKKVVVISTGMADSDLTNNFELPVAAPYCISKAAVNTAVAKYNALYKKDGVLFLAISPGFVDTGDNMPRTSEEMVMAAKFAEYAPHFKGPMTANESIKAVLGVVEKASIEKGDGGSFISHLGNKQWL